MNFTEPCIFTLSQAHLFVQLFPEPCLFMLSQAHFSLFSCFPSPVSLCCIKRTSLCSAVSRALSLYAVSSALLFVQLFPEPCLFMLSQAHFSLFSCFPSPVSLCCLEHTSRCSAVSRALSLNAVSSTLLFVQLFPEPCLFTLYQAHFSLFSCFPSPVSLRCIKRTSLCSAVSRARRALSCSLLRLNLSSLSITKFNSCVS